jgi:hypothetical protein
MKTKMKKILAAAVLALLSTGAMAQTTQGTVAVGGSVGFGTNTRNDEPDTRDVNNIYRSFHINPSFGYFVRDGLELGVSVGLLNLPTNRKMLIMQTTAVITI